MTEKVRRQNGLTLSSLNCGGGVKPGNGAMKNGADNQEGLLRSVVRSSAPVALLKGRQSWWMDLHR